jgi:hypothetical protein
LPFWLSRSRLPPGVYEPSEELKSEFVDKLNQFLSGEKVRFDCARRGFKYTADYTVIPWTYKCDEHTPDPNGPMEAIGIRKRH